MKPGKHQKANQDATILCWKVYDHIQPFLLRLYTCRDCVTKTFLLVSSSVRSEQQLCFVHSQDQKSEQKRTTKILDGFHNNSPLLSMCR